MPADGSQKLVIPESPSADAGPSPRSPQTFAEQLAALDAILRASPGYETARVIAFNGPDVGGLVGIARSYGWKPGDER